MLPKSIMTALEGILPSTIATSSGDGIPNVTNLSRIWFVDEETVAIADQLLRKTARNLEENPFAMMRVVDPHSYLHWEVEVRRLLSETEGVLFDRIARDLRAVAWMAGETEPVPLRSVIVFRVLSVRPCEEEFGRSISRNERFGELLEELSERLSWSRSSFWIPDGSSGGNLRLAASRGLPAGKEAMEALKPMKRIAGLVQADKRAVFFRNIRSQLRYLHTIRHEAGEPGRPKSDYLGAQPDRELATSFAGCPLFAGDRLAGILCGEATTADADTFDRIEEGFLKLLGARLGEAAAMTESMPPEEARAAFRQAIERASMEWARQADPFHTVLSPRERQVSVRAAQGWTNEEIAQSLFISKRTVTTHLERIYQKLNVGSRSALTRYVMEKNLHAEPEEGS
ncbi:LuxR C-terminal-related transcriptional regulator [Cohnella candidum]|nr:LuxR C-terminal-related transcriptional regulator [Cohnella candidum]